MTTTALIESAIEYAKAFIGTPYRWGGDDPMAGFDCSGFCIEVLQSVGRLPRKFDTTAQGLFDRFKAVSSARRGALVFWHGRDPGRIIHVEFCLDGYLALGASGGWSETVSVDAAIRHNAYIKMRPWDSRPGVAGFRDPFV